MGGSSVCCQTLSIDEKDSKKDCRLLSCYTDPKSVQNLHNAEAPDVSRRPASQAAPEAVRQAVGGGCRSGWGRLLSVATAIEPGTCR